MLTNQIFLRRFPTMISSLVFVAGYALWLAGLTLA